MMSGLIFPSSHLRNALPPERFAEEVMRIEAELDHIHPPWRQPAGGRQKRGIVGSMGIEDVERKARVKYLLQRRKHLYDGKDYEVVVTSYRGRDGSTKLTAHPIIPRETATEESIQAAAKRSWLPGEKPEQASLPQIAHSLGVPLERVERAALDCPEHTNLLSWVRRKLQAQDNGAPLPELPKRQRKVRVSVD